jgi:dephospho-CoA kinase
MQNNQKLMKIGITGGVGSGKTKVLTYLEENYLCKVLQADVIANALKQPGEICYESILSLLGKKVLRADGTIDNKKMAEIMFSSPEILKQVNDRIHPFVKKKIIEICENEEKKNKYQFIFIEAALLVETGYKDIVDEMWYIYAEKKIRKNRLRDSRGYTEKKIDAIFASQISQKEYEKACDVIIDNSGFWEETTKQIVKKMEGYSWKKD